MHSGVQTMDLIEAPPNGYIDEGVVVNLVARTFIRVSTTGRGMGRGRGVHSRKCGEMAALGKGESHRITENVMDEAVGVGAE